MPRCSAAGLDFRIIPAGFNPLRLRDSAASAPLEFLTGFTHIDPLHRLQGTWLLFGKYLIRTLFHR
jgi:hypothetical protein